MAYDRVLRQFRERVRTREYVLTLHAEEEMNADEFSVYDVERGVLNGEIVEQQREGLTKQPKYRLRGRAVSDRDIELVVKLGPSGTMIIITVYAL